MAGQKLGFQKLPGQPAGAAQRDEKQLRLMLASDVEGVGAGLC